MTLSAAKGNHSVIYLLRLQGANDIRTHTHKKTQLKAVTMATTRLCPDFSFKLC